MRSAASSEGSSPIGRGTSSTRSRPARGYVAGNAALDVVSTWEMALIALFAPFFVWAVYEWLRRNEIDETKIIPLGAGIYGAPSSASSLGGTRRAAISGSRKDLRVPGGRDQPLLAARRHRRDHGDRCPVRPRPDLRPRQVDRASRSRRGGVEGLDEASWHVGSDASSAGASRSAPVGTAAPARPET